MLLFGRSIADNGADFQPFCIALPSGYWYHGLIALEKGTVKRFIRESLTRIARDPAALALIGFNLAAGVMVLLRPPFAQSLFFLYWCDCVLIGLFGALKLVFVPIRLGPAADEHRVTAFIIRVVAKILLAAHFWEHGAG